jgi:nucleoside 2-deoxyribosyltransferase
VNGRSSFWLKYSRVRNSQQIALLRMLMQRIYLAGPLFNEAERAFNATLTVDIESLGYKVFLPQRDGVESDRRPHDALGRQERRLALFSLDRDQIFVCDIFLFILDGRVPDEGAAFELGIAYADKYINKKARLLIGLHTDARSAFFRQSSIRC